MYFFSSSIGARLTSTGAPFRDRYRVGLGARAAALFAPVERWGLEAQARYVYDLLGDDRRPLAVGAATGLAVGRAQVRAAVDAAGDYREARLELLAYF